jgi:hypothetical protein
VGVQKYKLLAYFYILIPFAMKIKTITPIYILLLLVFAFLPFRTLPQCTPLTAEQCPDPENNGEICPDTLAPGFLNQPYNVVATILPPAVIDTLSFQFEVNHITLDSVVNLPDGLSWESNALNNEFYPGNYYCVLMQGTPMVADTFHLKIYIGVFVYIELLGDTIRVTQMVDSTSLSIIIIDNTGITERQDRSFYIAGNSPNPFISWTSIRYYSEEPGTVEFQLYTMMGTLVDTRQAMASRGENYFHYLGDKLAPGTYFYLLRSNGRQAAGKMIKR